LTSLSSSAVRSIITPFILQPGLLRDQGETERLTIPDSAQLVEFKLEIGIIEYQNYQAILLDSSTETIWSRRKLKGVTEGNNAFVLVTLTADILESGEYIFVLKGVMADGQLERYDPYGFRVVRE
jgi:hypothetical protein